MNNMKSKISCLIVVLVVICVFNFTVIAKTQTDDYDFIGTIEDYYDMYNRNEKYPDGQIYKNEYFGYCYIAHKSDKFTDTSMPFIVEDGDNENCKDYFDNEGDNLTIARVGKEKISKRFEFIFIQMGPRKNFDYSDKKEYREKHSEQLRTFASKFFDVELEVESTEITEELIANEEHKVVHVDFKYNRDVPRGSNIYMNEVTFYKDDYAMNIVYLGTRKDLGVLYFEKNIKRLR